MIHLKTLLAVVAMLLVVPTVRADDDPLRLDVVPRTPFPKGTKTLQAEASYTTSIRYSVEEFVSGGVGVGYYVFDNHCLTLMANGFHVNQAFGRGAEAGSVTVMGRWHVFNPGRFTFYLDGGGGYSWANEAVPIGGTTYNFNARVGPGLGYRIDDNVYLMGGARYFHLSNAQQHGREKNPSYDGVEFYVGMLFAFR
jgi:long-subunit fatty acid transport protein